VFAEKSLHARQRLSERGAAGIAQIVREQRGLSQAVAAHVWHARGRIEVLQ
jgi:hypothetical protein